MGPDILLRTLFPWGQLRKESERTALLRLFVVARTQYLGLLLGCRGGPNIGVYVAFTARPDSKFPTKIGANLADQDVDS